MKPDNKWKTIAICALVGLGTVVVLVAAALLKLAAEFIHMMEAW